MKHNLLLALLFLAVTFSSNAQALTVSPINPSDSSADNTVELKVVSTVTNNTDSTMTLRWVRLNNNLPMSWESAVCDINTCWAPWIDSKTFTLGSQQSSDFSITFYPNSVDGTAIIDLQLYSVYDSANVNLTNTYTVMIDAALSTYSVWNDDIKVFPNPATEYIQLTDNGTATNMVIYNIVGRQVKTYKLQNTGTRYNVKNLPSGMYIVRLTDKNNRVVNTFRVNKR